MRLTLILINLKIAYAKAGYIICKIPHSFFEIWKMPFSSKLLFNLVPKSMKFRISVGEKNLDLFWEGGRSEILFSKF